MSTKRHSLRTAACLALLALATAMPRARAAEITNGVSGNWDATGTWIGGVVPSTNDNVTIAAATAVTVAQASTAYTISNLTVNGTLTHTGNNGVTDPQYKIDLTIFGDLTVSGAIDASGKGYAPGKGPAPGYYGTPTYGAAHGGLGGEYTAGTPGPNVTYGSITNPTTLGSGSGGSQGASGGGAVILRVSGQTILNGLISVDSLPGGNFSPSGSGGSINLTTATLIGSGTNSANGGNVGGGNTRPDGGGGRIAVKLTSGTSFGNVTMRAFGGSGGGTTFQGAAGTVYKQTASQPDGGGDLIVDNGGLLTDDSVTTAISTNVTATSAGSLIVTNSGKFGIAANCSFAVTSNFVNYAQTITLGGTFVVGGSGVSTLTGSVATTRFYNFTCTNAGKQIQFQSGNKYQLDNILTLNGTNGNPVKVNATGANAWKLSVPSLIHSVRYVDAAGSDASSGAIIEAINSVNSGGNTNWVFASDNATNIWTGAVSTDWGTAGNWSLSRIPVVVDVVRIDAGPSRWPILTATKAVNALLIASGAQVTLNGGNLTVLSNLVVAGTLTVTASETLTLGGAADFSSGVFTSAASTVFIAGNGAQTLALGNNAFATMTVLNTNAPVNISGAFTVVNFANNGGALTFQNSFTVGAFVNTAGNLAFNSGFTATNFTCSKAGVTIAFKDGAVYAVTNLTLNGASGNPITLVSASPGTAWKLNVSGASFVCRVTVSDSDASGGKTIRPVASTEGTPGSTVNWNFGTGSWKLWTGATASFTNASNWNPSGIPDATSRIYIESTNGIAAPLLTNTLTVGELAIGGGDAATLTLQVPLVVTGRVAILPGGVLTHTANGSTAQYWIDLTVSNDLEIASGGTINVDNAGFTSGAGPAPGDPDPGNFGGSHGGMGGTYAAPLVTSYSTYGSITNPTTLGSGGGTGRGIAAPTSGGGAVVLRVSGNTALNGRISAVGAPTQNFASGGAGGSINLTTATLSGNGAISAKSSDWAGNGNAKVCGGGGRVAVKLTSGNSFDNVSMLAPGGYYYNNQDYRGAPGTVYKQTASQAAGGDLIIDAGGYATYAAVATPISTNVIDGRVGNVTMRNSAKFVVSSNATLAVTGSWTNDGTATFTAEANSTVSFVGTNGGVVWGNNTFSKLSIGDPGTKPLTFQAGKTNTVQGDLAIYKAVLGSTSAGQWWYLTVTNNATQSRVQWVTVRDSNATNGAQIVVTKNGIDLGHNVNWKFLSPRGTLITIR